MQTPPEMIAGLFIIVSDMCMREQHCEMDGATVVDLMKWKGRNSLLSSKFDLVGECSPASSSNVKCRDAWDESHRRLSITWWNSTWTTQ